MAKKDKVQVDITGNDQKLNEVLGRSEKSLMSFGKKGIAVLAAIGAAVGASMVAFRAASKVVSFFVKMFADLDKVGKNAATFGVAADELMSLQFAAELSGTSIDSLTNSMRRVERFTVDATNGNQKAARAFEALNIDVEKFIGLSPDKKLKILADRMQGLDRAVQIALGFDLMGRQFTELIPLVQNGSEGIELLQDRFKRLGASLSPDQIADMEEFNDQLAEMQTAISGFSREIGGDVARPMAEIVAGLTELIVTAKGFKDQFKNINVELGFDPFRLLAESIASVFPPLYGLIDLVRQATDLFGHLQKAGKIKLENQELDRQMARLNNLRRREAELAGDEETLRALRGPEPETQINSSASVTPGEIARLEGEIKATEKRMKEEEKLEKMKEDAAKKVKEGLESAFDRFQQSVAELEDIENLLSPEEFTAEMERLEKAFVEAKRKEAEDAKTPMEKQQEKDKEKAQQEKDKLKKQRETSRENEVTRLEDLATPIEDKVREAIAKIQEMFADGLIGPDALRAGIQEQLDRIQDEEKPDEAFSASIESAQGLASRIQQAAASKIDPAIEGNKLNAKQLTVLEHLEIDIATLAARPQGLA